MSDSDDQIGVPLIEQLSDSDAPAQPASNKRKRDADGKKSAKRRKLKKPKDVNDEALDTDLGVNHVIAHMDSRLMADHIAQRLRRFQPELSLVEVEERHIPEKAIQDSTTTSKLRTAECLPEFLEQYAGGKRKKKLAHAHAEKGSPHTLIVAGAGLRAADLTRALRKYQTKDALVAKLFAKHIKLKEAIETVKQARISIGVGTPQRIIDLLDSGALKSEGLERVVVDASHIDLKKRGMLDMKETLVPLVELLARKEFRDGYESEEREKRLEVLFF